MKKIFLLLIVFCALCIAHPLKAQDKTVILFEDFEKGMPSTWSQEQVYGNYNWIVESGNLINPSGAVSGSRRVAFRNNTNQTTAYVTRLILPELDLSKVFQPILCFSAATVAEKAVFGCGIFIRSALCIFRVERQLPA